MTATEAVPELTISLITVTYNSSKFLEGTIKSILKQEYMNFEYIIIDGGSNDKTVDIIKRYEPSFQGKMRWISEPDKGMYDAINKGIRMATGDIVGIINSDDFFHRNDILLKIKEALENDKNIQAIYGDVRFVKANNTEKTIRYYSSKNWKPWKFRLGFMPAHPSFYTYKENFEKYGYYKLDYHIAADYELLIRHLYTNKVRAKYIPLDFMKMRIGGRSTNGIKANILLNKEIVRGCKENGIRTCMPLLFCKYFIKVFELIFTR